MKLSKVILNIARLLNDTNDSTITTVKEDDKKLPTQEQMKLENKTDQASDEISSIKLKQTQTTIKLGGFENIKGLKRASEPTPTQKKRLQNFLLKWDKAIAKIYDHLNYVNASIKQNQEDINTFYFEIATALLLLVILILGFRVIAFIFW